MSHTGLTVEELYAHTAAMQTVHGAVITYRLTLSRAPRVETTHSELDPTLLPGHLRVTTGDHALVIRSMDWAGREAALDAHVRAWILEHVNLRGVPLTSARRRDPRWTAAWRDANPWG